MKNTITTNGITNEMNTKVNNSAGSRKHYLDNIRWVTVVIVLLYHVFYMYNAEGVLGGVGKITTKPTTLI